MKKMLSIALLLVLLINVLSLPCAAYADSLSSYKGKTSYAGWYTVYRTKNCLSVNNKPENSSHRSVTRMDCAYNGYSVYVIDAQASGGTAKKWGRITLICDENGNERRVNGEMGFVCMYYLKKLSHDPTIPVGQTMKQPVCGGVIAPKRVP